MLFYICDIKEKITLDLEFESFDTAYDAAELMFGCDSQGERFEISIKMGNN